MKNKTIVCSILTFALTIPAFADKFNLDKAHTKVGFTINHLVISNVDGQFDNFEGSFTFDKETQKLENLIIEIDPASINTNEKKRDEHLRSKDFFDVENFPKMTFKGDQVTYKNKKPVKLAGDLTMHGVTKKVVLDLNYKGSITDPWGVKKVAFEASTKLPRKDFGLNWNKKLDTGGFVVGEEVEVKIKGEANAEAPQKP